MLQALMIAGGLYLAYGMTLYSTQRSMIYPGQALQPALGPDSVLPAGIQRHWLELGEDRVESWFIPAQGAVQPRPTLVITHGNYELIDSMAPVMTPLAAQGLNLLLVEFPGYGRSGGRPTQSTVQATILQAYDWLLTQPGVDPQRVVAYGRSLGGGAASILAAQREVAALILHSTFSDLRGFARSYGLPGGLIRDPYDNLAVVRNLQKPLLLIHGEADEAIAYSHAVALHAAAREATLISYPCGHNDCPPRIEQLHADLLGFLQHNGLLPAAANDGSAARVRLD